MKNEKKRNLRPVALVTVGAASSIMIAAGMTNSTLAGFVAEITNSNNTIGLGTLSMEESNQSGTIICKSVDGTNNSATCSTINKYGGNLTMTPGSAVTTTINIKNTGTAVANTFTLTPSTCTQSGGTTGSATDFCSKVNVKVVSGATTIYDGPASGFNTVNLAVPVNPGQTVPFTFTVSTPTTLDNTYQGLQASQPLTWKFAA